MEGDQPTLREDQRAPEPGGTLGGVVLTVNGDQGVVERQLGGGELACPLCGGVLAEWGTGSRGGCACWKGRTRSWFRAGHGAGGAAGRMCCWRPGAWRGG